MFDLMGKTALITGSTRGIGYEAARALARQGATVLLNGRQKSSVDKAVQSLQKEGLQASPVVFDIEQTDAMLQAVKDAEQQHGVIDILFANAATQYRAPLLSYPQQEFERIVFANLTSQWVLGRHLAQAMSNQGFGRIIFTGSITGVLGRPEVTAYTAAKAALHGLVRQWASELSPQGVTVNAIAPGYLQTQLTQALSQEQAFNQWLQSRVPSEGGWGRPEDIASTVVYLAALESRFVTGQVIAVDGGLSTTMV